MMKNKSKVYLISQIASIPESEEDDDAKELSSKESADTPMHHMVLFHLLGQDKAESILNPKIEEPSVHRRSVHPSSFSSILLPPIDFGFGARAILKTLKEKSNCKIMHLEKKIPAEWKQAYNSYLRNRLAKGNSVHFRCFSENPDVPDLHILKSQDYIHKIRRIRSHTNVMFNSSNQNLNKTTLLLGNNSPFLGCHRKEKDISLKRYFDEKTLDPHVLQPPRFKCFKELQAVQRPSNIRFLEKNEVEPRGTFHTRYSSEDTIKMVTDVPGQDMKIPISGNPTRRREEIATSQATNWHPLTLRSLMEYSPNRQILGTGSFTHGVAPRWKNLQSQQYSKEC